MVCSIVSSPVDQIFWFIHRQSDIDPPHRATGLLSHKNIFNANVNVLKGRKEGNVLFNDALNTFYLWLYGVKHMVKDHSDSEKGYFYMHHPKDRIAYTTAFVTPVVEHWLKREIAQWVHPMKDRSDDPSHHELC